MTAARPRPPLPRAGLAIPLALALAAALAALVAGPAVAAGVADPGGADGDRRATGPLDASFAVPAQATGGLDARGQWALLLVHGPAGFAFSLPAGATVANTTVLRAERTGGDDVAAPLVLPARSATLAGPASGRLGFAAPAWGALYVEADSLRLAADGARADLRRSSAGDPASGHLPPASHPADAVEPYPGSSAALRLAADGAVAGVAPASGTASGTAGLAVTLHATGLRQLHWHNASLACARGPCPDAGRPAAIELGAGSASRVERLSYIDVATAGGSLEGGGRVVVAAVGGPALDLAVAGHVRLPGASLAGACPGGPCPDPGGRTFLADGRVELAGLARDDDPARLRAQLSGRFAAVGFDEEGRGEFGAAAAVAAGAAVLLAWALKAAAGLFARSARPPALRHPRRQRLYQILAEEPGLSSRELQRRAGWATGVFRHHLNRLLEARLVVAQPHRNTLRYFENNERYRAGWRQVLGTRGEGAQRLLALVALRPGVGQAAIVVEAASWGWTRTTTRRRLRGLLDAGLVDAQREGRRARYTARPAAAPGAGTVEVAARVPGTGRAQPQSQPGVAVAGSPAPLPAIGVTVRAAGWRQADRTAG